MPPHSTPVRASDAEREQTVALLQHGFTDGRLTQAELEERAAAAYAARTTAELSDLTADLPGRSNRHGRAGSWTGACCASCCASTPRRAWSTGCYLSAGSRHTRPRAGDSLQRRKW
jgi:hypothetical protein